jgi:glycosyltransferase involved in cell wall biosynthesis
VSRALSAIVLGYRAEESLLQVVQPLHDLLEHEGLDFELIVVANYWADANDETPEVARQFAAGKERVATVIQTKRGGMGWDMCSGFDAAAGDVMIVIDGDAQNPVADVVKLYQLMRETGADVGKGRRVSRHDGPYRRLVSLVYNIAFQLLFRTRGVWDVNGKPKGLTRNAYEILQPRSDDWFIDAEIVLGARERGLKIAELPVTFFRNNERASFVKPSAILEFAAHMLQRRFRR